MFGLCRPPCFPSPSPVPLQTPQRRRFLPPSRASAAFPAPHTSNPIAHGPLRAGGAPALTRASYNRGSDACEESSAPCSCSIQPGDTFPAGTLVTQVTPAPWQCAGKGLGLPENGRKAWGELLPPSNHKARVKVLPASLANPFPIAPLQNTEHLTPGKSYWRGYLSGGIFAEFAPSLSSEELPCPHQTGGRGWGAGMHLSLHRAWGLRVHICEAPR